jgi:peroxiredoxin
MNNTQPLVSDAQFVSLDGKRLRLRDFRGRLVLLNFWATTNISSRAQIPVLNELQKNYVARGLTVIGISRDDAAEKVREFQKEIPQDYLVGLGGQEIERQLETTLPTSYIIDRRGQVRKKLIGPQTREAFEAAIATLISERP